MNKIISLFAVFCIAIALLGCGGGGGGGGNPLASYVEPGLDNEFMADPRYAGIVNSLSSMTNALVDPNDKIYDPNDDTAAKARTTLFMSYIADDFRTTDGSKTGAEARKLLIDYTASRLHRYTVSKYIFKPTAHQTVDENTVKVTTHIFLTLTKKTWSGGTVPGSADEYNGPYEGGDQVVEWRKDSSGVWKIFTGLPKEMYGPISGSGD